ncbi:TPA: hypothetical protein U0J99_001754 [Streptococcus suis]|nr:hypothetical protein [Streptococcus suis]
MTDLGITSYLFGKTADFSINIFLDKFDFKEKKEKIELEKFIDDFKIELLSRHKENPDFEQIESFWKEYQVIEKLIDIRYFQKSEFKTYKEFKLYLQEINYEMNHTLCFELLDQFAGEINIKIAEISSFTQSNIATLNNLLEPIKDTLLKFEAYEDNKLLNETTVDEDSSRESTHSEKYLELLHISSSTAYNLSSKKNLEKNIYNILTTNVKDILVGIHKQVVVKNKLVEEIVKKIENGSYQHYFLNGESGSGKSILLIQLLHELMEDKSTFYLQLRPDCDPNRIESDIEKSFRGKYKDIYLFIDNPASNLSCFYRLVKLAEKKSGLKLILCERNSSLKSVLNECKSNNDKHFVPNTLFINLFNSDSENVSIIDNETTYVCDYIISHEFKLDVIKKLLEYSDVDYKLANLYLEQQQNLVSKSIVEIYVSVILNCSDKTKFGNSEMVFPWDEWQRAFSDIGLGIVFPYIASLSLYGLPFSLNLISEISKEDILIVKNRLRNKEFYFLQFDDFNNVISLKNKEIAELYFRLNDEFGWYKYLNDFVSMLHPLDDEIIKFEQNVFNYKNILSSHKSGHLSKMQSLFRNFLLNENLINVVKLNNREHSIDFAKLELLIFSKGELTEQYEFWLKLFKKYILKKDVSIRILERYLKTVRLRSAKTKEALNYEREIYEFCRANKDVYSQPKRPWEMIQNDFAKEYSSIRRYKEAKAIYLEIVDNSPEDLVSRISFAGLLCKKLHDFEDAEAQYKDAKQLAIKSGLDELKNFQSYINSVIGLCDLYLDRKSRNRFGNKKDNENKVKVLFKEVDKRVNVFYEGRANISQNIYKIEESVVAFYQKQLEYYYRRDFNKYKNILSKLREKFPNNVRVLYEIGLYHYRMRDINKTKKYLELSLEKSAHPYTHLTTLVRYCTLLHYNGDLDTALYFLIIALFIHDNYNYKRSTSTIQILSNFEFQKAIIEYIKNKDYRDSLHGSNTEKDINNITRRMKQVLYELKTQELVQNSPDINIPKEMLFKNKEIPISNLLSIAKFFQGDLSGESDFRTYERLVLDIKKFTPEKTLTNRYTYLTAMIIILRVNQKKSIIKNLDVTTIIRNILENKWTIYDVR